MRLAAALEIFLGVGAVAGGLGLVLAPDGSVLGLSTAPLAGSPFHDFLVPGIVLLTVIGIWPLVAGILTLRGSPRAPRMAAAVGLLLIIWIVVEMLVFARLGGLLWAFYLLLGCGILVQSRGMARRSTRPTRR
jgi:hypothetical protein